MDTEKLKALAQAATPGPWKYDEDNGFGILPENGCEIIEYLTIGNARYIAAANPATILELIAQRDELLAALARLCRELPRETVALGQYYAKEQLIHARSVLQKVKAGTA